MRHCAWGCLCESHLAEGPLQPCLVPSIFLVAMVPCAFGRPYTALLLRPVDSISTQPCASKPDCQWPVAKGAVTHKVEGHAARGMQLWPSL